MWRARTILWYAVFVLPFLPLAPTRGFMSFADPAPLVADSTYTYKGNPFTFVQPGSGLSSANYISGTVSFASPLPPNLTRVDVAAFVTSYSFTDGVHSASNADGRTSPWFFVSTGPNGQITAWDFELWTFTTGVPEFQTTKGITSCRPNGCSSGDGDGVSIANVAVLATNNNPGKWAVDPVLIVPHWFQVGIPPFSFNTQGFIYNNWGQMQLDKETPFNPMAGPPLGLGTIARNGCALTALTMVYNFWAGNKQSPPNGTTGPPYPGIPPANPANPDDKTVLNNAAGLFIKPSGQVTWSFALWNQMKNPPPLVKMYRECPGTGPSCNNTFPLLPNGATADPTQTLVNILRNQVPVILPILGADGNEHHWVVVTGFNSKATDLAQFLVNDPGDAVNVKTLDDVGSVSAYHIKDGITQLTVKNSLNNIDAWKVYTKVTNPLAPLDPITPQALGVYSDAPVELILTDPQGRRTGFDPFTNTLFQDIPTSDYETSAYCDELGSSGCNSPFKTLEMANQIPGQYTLNVTGTGSGAFTVSVRASDAAGNWITQTYSGTAAPGVTSQFTFDGAVITFAAFGANLAISSSFQAFAVDGTITLGPGGTISPVAQPVTIQVGNAFSATIPAGSFTQTPQGTFAFGGVVQGILLAAELTPTGGNGYTFAIVGVGVPNLPSANPVDIRLAIGSNGGNTSVNANFLP
jgi:hypothetical protein